MTETKPNVIDPAGSGDRAAEPGYDHDLFPWSPAPERPEMWWPGGHPVAVAVALDLHALEWRTTPVPPPGGRGPAPDPDIPRISHREFGHRVGIFRLLSLAGEFAIPLAAAVDVLTVEHYQPLMRHLRPRIREYVAGGMSASRPVTSRMAVDEEEDYVRSTLDRLEHALGTRPGGWFGPEHSESARTIDILTRLGVQYVTDWANDDRPYRMGTTEPAMWSFPLSWELSDVNTMFIRGVEAGAYAQSIEQALDVMTSTDLPGGALGLQLSPWLSGQAFRASAVKRIFTHLRKRSDIWLATPGEIVAWARNSG